MVSSRVTKRRNEQHKLILFTIITIFKFKLQNSIDNSISFKEFRGKGRKLIEDHLKSEPLFVNRFRISRV